MPRSALPQASEKSKSSAKKMFPTHSLMEQPLFRNRNRILRLSPADRIQLSFARAREVISAYGINIADLQDVSSRVWRMHCDPIWSLDGAAGTIATIHVNLVMGTLAKFQHLPHVSQLLQKMLNFEVNGQYCLTELGHGLDVFALETRVDLTAEGDFRLNTPNPRAAKYMPPTTPCGYPVTAVVFARLFVRGHDHGIKPFIVPIHDGTCMYQGVSSTALHLRGGSNPVLHALTSFRNVRLPSTALLGSIDRATDQKTAFFSQIDRVVSGTLVMGGLAAMGVGMSASIVSAYSHRRHVSDPVTGKPIPIISFPTQITPILTAVAQSHVLHAYGESTRQQFGQTETITQRHFLAAVWKVTAARMAMASMQVLIDRCGAQGLFEINQLTTMLADLRGSAVAEGDIQALAIRFAVDVLLGRVEMTDPVDDSSLLTRHEQGVLTELMGVLAGLKNPRREMAAVVLPQAFRIIESIGHRMAVDAARHAGVDCRLIAVFEAGVIHCDPAWYSENGISHVEQARIEREAIEAAAPALRDFVQDLGMEGHIQAPIFSDEKWDEYVSQLDTFEAPAVGHQQTSEDRLAPVWGGSQIQFTAAKL